MKNIVYVDNDPLNLDFYREQLEKHNFCVTCLEDPDSLLPLLRNKKVKADVVLLDMFFGPDDCEERGLELLHKVKAFYPELPVILFTGRMGAPQYKHKVVKTAVEGYPFAAVFPRDERLGTDALIEKIHEIKGADAQPTSAERYSEWTDRFKFVIGETPAMIAAAVGLELAAQSKKNVLLLGETGTGKEVAANALHLLSSRRDGPFIKVNMTAITQTLWESEFFGHRKGSFTGASEDKAGFVKNADNGTLFLDEIGDMPFELQSKLLRFTESGEYQPVGGRLNTANIRIVAATNKDPEKLIEPDLFRKDLFYRLSVHNIWLPPLRSRTKADFERLFIFFVTRYENKKMSPVLQRELLHWLIAQPWPGNVREFKNTTEKTILLTRERFLQVGDFEKAKPDVRPDYLGHKDEDFKAILERVCNRELTWQQVNLKMIPANEMPRFLSDLIRLLTQKNNRRPTGNVIAELFQITPVNMRGKLKQYGIELLDFPES